jgi:hypothetical protein
MADRITYVGLDAHKESIVVAVAEGGLGGGARCGSLAGSPTRLRRWTVGMTLRWGRAVMAFNVDCRRRDMSVPWSLRR